MITAEEKEFVLNDRSSDRATKLIAFQRAALDCIKIASIEQIVANKFEQIAVNLIRARFGHRAHLRSTGLLGRLSANLCLEFCQCIRKWERQRQAIIRIDMAYPVQRVLGGRTQAACGRDHNPALECISTSPISRDRRNLRGAAV